MIYNASHKTLLDFGTNFGQGLKKVMKLEAVTSAWRVMSYEANPITFKRIDRLPYVTYLNYAVSDRNGEAVLNAEEWPEGKAFVGGGSTLMDLSNWNTQKVYGMNMAYEQMIVQTKDVHDIMNDLDLADKSCLMKMDIEGSEYAVLRRIIDTGMVNKVYKLYIEFHDHICNVSEASSEKCLTQELLDHDVELIRWY